MTALSDPEERLALEHARALQEQVGHPGELFEALRTRIQVDGLREFRAAQVGWVELMWSLDAYKRAGVPPVGMGKPDQRPKARLDGVYRTKGNWFATLLVELLRNRTQRQVGSRTRVQGFSQLHQIDLAWPDREIDPLVCVETKVTGGPAYGTTPSRAAMSDFSNRRKELKFAATDLKLWRRQQETTIRHWGEWRSAAMPRAYFLWAARLKTDGHKGRGNDNLSRLITEAGALVNTYLDGAGIFAWRTNAEGTAYEVVDVPASAAVTALDDVLYRVESVITSLAPSGDEPPPQPPAARAVDVRQLEPDDGDA